MKCVAVAGWRGVGGQGGQWNTPLLLGASKSAKQREEATRNDCNGANCDGEKKTESGVSRTGKVERRTAGKRDRETANASGSEGVDCGRPL